MSAGRDLVYLRDMVDSARRAMSYAAGMSDAQFYATPVVQDAVAWRITIIGEAARRVSEASRRQMPGLPWRLIVQMRNKLVHEYGKSRTDIVWETLGSDLPPLMGVKEAFLASPPPEGSP